MLAAIWAQDKNGLIGKNNRLPWHLPNDQQFFKKMTVGNILVMGRKTFEGMGARPLPNRETIILTRDPSYKADNVRVLHTVKEVLELADSQTTPIFIAGGTEIYQWFLPYCDYLYRTVIDEIFDGDTYFPAVDWSKWTLSKKEDGILDDKNHYKHQFETYERKIKTRR